MATLKKLLSLCERNQILKVEKKSGSSSINLHYGPLGSLLKRNIFNEWLCSLLNHKDVPVFPLEVPDPVQASFLEPLPFPAVLNTWLGKEELFKGQTPFGYAIFRPCVNAFSNTASDVHFTDFGFLSGLPSWTRLSLVFFCPEPVQWFHFWSKQRYIWWRKFSSIPSQFSLSSGGSGQHQLWVRLNSSEPLERVAVGQCPERGPFVACHTELEAALVAHLANAHAHKWREGHTTEVLHLHSRLCPYQVALVCEAGDEKLGAAADHLTCQLKERGVSVLPPTHLLNPSKFDEMGVPYTIVLGRSSLANGIAGLRNRDTTLQEQVHITELSSKLIKYLKVKS